MNTDNPSTHYVRQVHFHYTDPLEIIWQATAARLGMEIVRDDSVFAAWDGNGCLRIGPAESLDADDHLAQIVFHELCHALVEGPAAWSRPDWGLDFENPEHRVNEFACLRLQAALADRHGLRDLMASTTDFRYFYDELPTDPLTDERDESATLARAGYNRAQDKYWAEPLHAALAATAVIRTATQPFAERDSIWSAK